MPTSLSDRFWPKVAKSDYESCWLWQAATDRFGYGRIQIAGRGSKVDRAHRVSWEIHHGPVPEGLNVLHRCDVPACVNPLHLFLGSKKDNTQDMVKKGRAKGGARNPLKGERNPMAKISNEDAKQIIRLYQEGNRQKDIAALFGIKQPTVSMIVNGNRRME